MQRRGATTGSCLVGRVKSDSSQACATLEQDLFNAISDNAYVSLVLKIDVKLVSHDLIQDITLRALSVVVLTSLIVCLAFLAFRSFWLQRFERIEVVAPAAAAVRSMEEVPAPPPVRAERPEVLMNPGVVYRCVERGKVGYSDRPCVPESQGRAGK